MTALLHLQGITKRFGALVANDGISLTLHAGEVLALLGENGAGKSTLMAILFGHYMADAGQVLIDGRPLTPGDTRAALAAGIGMVHQHFTLADNLSVLDNTVLGTEPLWAWRSDRAGARARLLATAEAAGLSIDPDARVADLSVGERQRVEILKALVRGARLLVLDEPTAVLTPQEAEGLFATLRRLVAQGLAVVFISHKLAEVMAISQRVLVLRHGRVVAESATADTDVAQLARWMVGEAAAEVAEALPAATPGGADPHPLAMTAALGAAAAPATAAAAAPTGAPTRAPARAPADGPPAASAAPRLLVQGLHARGGRQRLVDLNLQIAAGEILGIAGVSGNGQTLLAEVLAGVARATAGTLQLDGQALPATPRGRVAAGLARVPEDRQAVGIIGDLSVWENAVAEALAGGQTPAQAEPAPTRHTTRHTTGHTAGSPAGHTTGSPGSAAAHDTPPPPRLSRWGWIRAAEARRYAQGLVQAFDVRGAALNRRARLLSGGNVQKLILGRVLQRPDGRAPRVVIAHQPTWGLDIGAVAFVHQRLRQAAAAGAAVLLISDDLDELQRLAQRIAVICHGHLGAARPTAAWTREALGLAMAGAELPPAAAQAA